jgi:hypothetical protein
MYEKPELTLVGEAAHIVLGAVSIGDDSETLNLENVAGVLGLDD